MNFSILFFRKTRELAKELNDKAIEAQVCLFYFYFFLSHTKLIWCHPVCQLVFCKFIEKEWCYQQYLTKTYFQTARVVVYANEETCRQRDHICFYSCSKALIDSLSSFTSSHRREHLGRVTSVYIWSSLIRFTLFAGIFYCCCWIKLN